MGHLISVKCTKTHIYYAMKNCNGDANTLKNYITNIVDHYQVSISMQFNLLQVKLIRRQFPLVWTIVDLGNQFKMKYITLLIQGDHTRCHQESRCQEDGYVCSKKLLVSEKAIAAYRKAVEGTTIFKNAEDYVLVLLITDYGLAFYWMICPITFQSIFIEYDKLRTLQSNGNIFPFMYLEYHTAWFWIWVRQMVWKEDQGGAVTRGVKGCTYSTCR